MATQVLKIGSTRAFQISLISVRRFVWLLLAWLCALTLVLMSGCDSEPEEPQTARFGIVASKTESDSYLPVKPAEDAAFPGEKPWIKTKKGKYIYGAWIWVYAEKKRENTQKVLKFAGKNGQFYNTDGSIWLEVYQDSTLFSTIHEQEQKNR